jgi:hypothetical protein
MIGPSSSYPSRTVTQEWQEKSQQDSLHLTLTSLEQSSLLYQSCIDHEALQLNEESERAEQRGSVLIGQLENLVASARALNQIIQIARRENTGLVTTGFTLAAGLGALWQGQIPWGLALTGAALNEVKKILLKGFSSPETKDLVEEVRTGLLMIEQLEEYQKSSLETIERQIETVEGQLDDIENQFTEIQSLATEGSKDGEAKKQEAIRISQEANRAYRQALYDLLSKASIIANSEEFKSVINALQELIEQAKSEDLTPTDFETFVDQTQAILQRMVKTHQSLEENQKLFNSGLQQLHEASKLNKEALANHLEAGAIMQRHLFEIQMKAKVDSLDEAREHLQAAKEEVQIAKERADNIQAVAEHERKKIDELHQRIDDQWGTTSMMVGMTAATIGVAVGGGVISIPLGAGMTAATHYTRRVYRYAEHYFNKSKPIENPPKALSEFTVSYDPTSTGWGGYVIGLISKMQGGQGRASKTAGIIALNIGGSEPVVYRFNRNSTSDQGKMDERDIKKLNDDLRKQLKDGTLDYQQCLMIINSLANVDTEHGPITLVAPDCLFLRDLKNECMRNIDDSP